MEKFTAKEKELQQMEVWDSFNEAYDNDWFHYASILSYRDYGIPDLAEEGLDNQWETALRDFWSRYMHNNIERKFSKIEYLENDKYSRIRETIKAFGLDIEKFWILLLYIYEYTSDKLIRGNNLEDVSKTLFAQSLMKKISDCKPEDIEIVIKLNNKKINISDVGKESIITMLDEGYDRLYKNAIGYDIQLSKFKDNTNYSLSHCMTRAVHEYEYVFNELEKDGYIKPDRSTGASLNKMLLFSQIMHLYRWTYNDNFLYDNSSLKGVLKTYKNKKLPRTISTTYW